MTARQYQHLQVYRDLIKKFCQKQVDVTEFEETYLARFKNEDELFPDEVFSVLDKLFGYVDAYAPASLPSHDGIGEETLRLESKKALDELNKMV